MRYTEVTKNRYTRFRTNAEPLAREYYKNTQKLHHKNLIVKQCGFLVKQTHPHLGASSDGIVSCTHHNDRVLEIRCPHNFQNELKQWRNDKKFHLNPNGSFKENHPYYFQIQLEMLIQNLNGCHFLIFCKQKPNGSILHFVTRDNNLQENMLEKFEQYFHKIRLPEIVTRKLDISNENDRKAYCFCRRTNFGNTIACDCSTCSCEWFHYGCIDITRASKGRCFYGYCWKKQKNND